MRHVKWLLLAFIIGVLVTGIATVFLRPSILSSKRPVAHLPLGFEPFEWPQDFGGLPLVGALVQISPTQGFRYLIPLEECGLDKEILMPIPGVIAIPSVALNENADVNLAANISRIINFGSSARAAQKIAINLGPTTDEMILAGRVVLNAAKHPEILAERCGQFLGLENVFWVSNALKSRSFKLTFYEEKGGKLEVSSEKLPQFVSKAKADVGISATGDGGVEITSPVYVGFRYAPPAELLTGKIQPFAVDETRTSIAFGEEIFAQYRLNLPHHNRREK
jgi:hypothetical protein